MCVCVCVPVKFKKKQQSLWCWICKKKLQKKMRRTAQVSCLVVLRMCGLQSYTAVPCMLTISMLCCMPLTTKCCRQCSEHVLALSQRHHGSVCIILEMFCRETMRKMQQNRHIGVTLVSFNQS